MKRPSAGLYCLIVLLAAVSWPSTRAVRAQPQVFDTSKPTNYYTYQDNALEFSAADSSNIFGYRGILTLATGERSQLAIELPLLYNDRSEKGGLGDMGLRYSFLLHKDYDRFLGAAAATASVFIPTGRVEDGLGTSRWVLSPGLMLGLMVADWIQVFPGVSYEYVSKSASLFIPEVIDRDRHGMKIQAVIPIIFSARVYAQVIPTYAISDFSDSGESGFRFAVRGSYTLSRKYQAAVAVESDLEADRTTARASFLVFFGG
jgi:hypothetical protein